MNRGINKVSDENATARGETTKAEPIRMVVMITEEMEKKIDEISEVMSLEKAATARMLLNFAVRFASPFDITSPEVEARLNKKGTHTVQVNTRVTQETFDKIEGIVKDVHSNKSAIAKRMLAWALDNIGRYTIEEWLAG